MNLIFLTQLFGLITAKEIHVNRKPQSFSADEGIVGGEYETTIYMGTPLQKVANMVMDTGSFLPWVKVAGDGWCKSTTCPGIPPTLNALSSSTFNLLYSSVKKSEAC